MGSVGGEFDRLDFSSSIFLRSDARTAASASSSFACFTEALGAAAGGGETVLAVGDDCEVFVTSLVVDIEVGDCDCGGMVRNEGVGSDDPSEDDRPSPN